jgi:hypothetical protein
MSVDLKLGCNKVTKAKSLISNPYLPSNQDLDFELKILECSEEYEKIIVNCKCFIHIVISSQFI